MNDIDPIVISIDERPATESIKRVNKAIDGVKASADASGKKLGGSLFDSIIASAGKAQLALSDSFRQMERLAIQAGKGMEASFGWAERTLKSAADGAEHLNRLLGEAKKTVDSFAGTLATGATAAAIHATFIEQVVNRVRVARVAIAAGTSGFEGALAAGTSIAGVIAAEKIMIMTYQRAATLQQQGLAAARSGLSYGDTVGLQFSASRDNRSLDFFDSTAKSAGGVDQLAEKLRKLGEVRDPIDRMRQAFAAFGENAGAMLPFLDSRFENNIRLVHEWGLVLDTTSRTNIDQFKRDVDSLKDVFDGLGGTIKAWSQNMGNWFAQGFGSLYATLRQIPGAAAGLLAKIPHVNYWGRNGPAELDTDEAVARLQGEVGATEMVRSIRGHFSGAGTRYFAKGPRTSRFPGGDTVNEEAIRDMVEKVRAGLFVTDRTKANYGELVPAAAFPGGYKAQAKALEAYTRGNLKLDQIAADDAAKKAADEASKAAESAAKAAARAFQSLVEGFQKSTDQIAIRAAEFGMDTTGRLAGQRNRDLTAAAAQGIPASDIATRRTAYDRLLQKTAAEEGGKYWAGQATEIEQARSKAGAYAGKQFATGLAGTIAGQEATQQADRAILTIANDAARSNIMREAGRSQRIAELTFDQPGRQIEAGYRIQIDLAKQLYRADLDRAELETDANIKRIDYAKAYSDLEKQTGDAIIERDMKIRELNKQREEGFKRNFADAAMSIQDRQFGSYVKSQAKGLERIVLENAGGLVFGAGGKGLTSGIPGLSADSTLGKLLKGTPFGPQDKNPLTIAQDANTVATSQNTAATYALASALSGSGGGGSFGGGGGFSGSGGGFALPPYVGGSGLGSIQSVGAGGTNGFSAFGMGASGGRFGALRNLFGFGGEQTVKLGDGSYTTGSAALAGMFKSGGGFGTGLKALGQSDAAAAAGTALAMKGLLGKDEGTWKGIGEGTAGGALIGYKYGGPLGAGIGAAVGFGIGTGEKLAGVESQAAEAKRLVKSRYGLTIDNQFADQIVQVANSKYAHHVSIAVVSPEIRQMMELYAAGTGQRVPLSASTPRAGSLTEQGGSLFQAPTYQYGQAYSFAGGRSVLGGGATTQLPNGISIGSLQLTVGDRGASDFLAGSVVTPDLVASRYGSSLASSNNRVATSAMFQSPGLITG